MATVNFNISVPDPDRFETALVDVQKAGLKVSQSFSDLGVLSGEIDSRRVAQLRRIPGLTIEEDRTVVALSQT